MDYPELQLDVLVIFAEAQGRAASMSSHRHCAAAVCAPAPRPVPRIHQPIGRLPALAQCMHCGLGITSSDPKIIQAHVRRCGVRHSVVPQRK